MAQPYAVFVLKTPPKAAKMNGRIIALRQQLPQSELLAEVHSRQPVALFQPQNQFARQRIIAKRLPTFTSLPKLRKHCLHLFNDLRTAIEHIIHFTPIVRLDEELRH
jgi:hypothetical protein